MSGKGHGGLADGGHRHDGGAPLSVRLLQRLPGGHSGRSGGVLRRCWRDWLDSFFAVQ
ncbi:hypothetical protein DVU_2207 [Nitratidesulfovibrio vulgaris str. Hildenborough]|uniref:Uncharacterized protein n=1 Tax=Nitratidesulfovibrio vulgaris (strain ATCC 29579 / DSM 644 / CCUG 34227 / NCIMB 8303 / VKM B-1760 / Hildenborough) TaxID=882 RepID=Q729Z0_NITV2|nr:hypothetical protein DVU_2207 [Nitratidesulfovibrio vulgaris str. Hildenborough]